MRQMLNGTWFCVLLLTASLTAGAATLKVSPARFIVHDVSPGEMYDIHKETGLRLTVFNDDDIEHTWMLSTHRPSERGRWETGYGEIPDATWCWFGESEVTVPPHDVAHGHLFLQIPDEEQYYNQHWIATLTVGGLRKGGLGLALAVDIRVQIETKDKTGLTSVPHGLLGLEPSALQFEDVLPGASREASVLLHNNSDQERTYTIGSLFLDKKHKLTTYLKQSYAVIPELSWFGHPRSVSVQPGASATLNLSLNVPNGADHFNKKWGDCILIQPDKGRAEFVRVQVHTRKSTNGQPTQGVQP